MKWLRKLFPSKYAPRFVLVIGDKGAVLTLINNKKLEQRLYAPSPSQEDRREFSVLLTKYPDTPIYVLLDAMDQNYSRQSLPAVSALSINSLVQRRLKRDFPESDIKGALFFNRTTTGRRDWTYIFVSTPLSPTLSEWLGFLTPLPNKFAGIYFLPLEMENLLKAFNKVFFKGNDKPSSWQFVVSHNKTGGFRQIVLQNHRVIFTRYIHTDKQASSGLLAGNITQEILNTSEYLRRLGYDESKGMDVFVIASQEIKNTLMTTKLHGNKVLLLTPHEASTAIGFPDICAPEDKFADVPIAMHFSRSKPVLKLFTPETREIHYFYMAYAAGFYLMAILGTLFLLYSMGAGIKMWQMANEIDKHEAQKAEIELQWKTAQVTSNYGIDEANKISEVVELHKLLTTTAVSPLTIFKELAAAKGNDAYVKALNWRYYPEAENNKMIATFNFDFINPGTNLEELFRNFDNFTDRITNRFLKYRVEYSKLPDKITFEEKDKALNVQVTITGPKAEEKTPAKPAEQIAPTTQQKASP